MPVPLQVPRRSTLPYPGPNHLIQLVPIVLRRTIKKHINVVGAVIVDGATILAARRSAKQSLPGTWEFPGGKIEAGETPTEALAREIREELRCDAIIGKHVTTTTHEYDFATIVLSTYFCTISSGTPQLTEHAEIRWVPMDKLHELEWAPADIPAVELIPALLQ